MSTLPNPVFIAPRLAFRIALIVGAAGLGCSSASAQFTITKLGRFDGSGQTMAYGINNQGEVVGSSIVGGVETGFVWSRGELTAATGSTALVGIDDAGNAVGWTYSGGNVDAVVYTPKGGVEYLFNPLTSESVVREISASGHYVGHYQPWNPTTNSSAGDRFAIIGNIGTPGATNIVPPANTSIEAIAVNNSGLVVGSSFTSGGDGVEAATFHAPYLSADRTHLGTLSGGFTSVATDISESGVVVGYGTIAGSLSRGFRTDAEGNLESLGIRDTANSQNFNYDARGVNDFGMIVGNELGSGGTTRLVLYDANGTAYLPTLTPGQGTSELTRVYLPNTTLSGSNYVGSPINEYGQIVAVGLYGGVQEAVLLSPDQPLMTISEDGREAVARIVEDRSYTRISAGATELGEFASFLGGTTGANRTVEFNLGSPIPGEAIPMQTLELSGTGEDIFVLQLRFNIAEYEAAFGDWHAARLGWLDPESGEWTLAVDGNLGGTAGFVDGYYTNESLGSHGLYEVYYDPGYAFAWAVLNHNSTFGIISGAIPEPASAVWLAGVAAMLIAALRRKRD